MNNAMIPIISYNFGRRDKTKVDSGIRYGMLYTLVILGRAPVALQVFASADRDFCGIRGGAAALYLCHPHHHARLSVCGGEHRVPGDIPGVWLRRTVACAVAHPPDRGRASACVLFTRLPDAELLVWSAFPIAEGAGLVCALVLICGSGWRARCFWPAARSKPPRRNKRLTARVWLSRLSDTKDGSAAFCL